MENQTDFVQKRIRAKHWSYFGANPYRIGLRSKLLWVPISKRAIAWFEMAAYECNDPKLEKEVWQVMGTKQLKLSVIYTSLNLQLGSRVKDVTELVEVLDGMEKVFRWGYQNGTFKKIMDKNPSTMDFWALMDCINAERNSKVNKRFVRTFSGALNQTFDRMVASVQ